MERARLFGVVDERIASAAFGPTPETLPAFEREIDLGGDLVMPGFKNAHAHAGMSFVRSYADDVPLQPWLFEQIFPLEAKLTPEAVYAFTKLSILEYLTSGITAGFDMYYFREAIAQASIDCGFRTVLCGGGGSAQQLEAEYRRFNALHPLISYQLGLHSEYTSSLAEMTEAGELARTLRAPVFAHNAETAREVAECRERWGKTPTELVESLGHFDFGGGGFRIAGRKLGEPVAELLRSGFAVDGQRVRFQPVADGQHRAARRRELPQQLRGFL